MKNTNITKICAYHFCNTDLTSSNISDIVKNTISFLLNTSKYINRQKKIKNCSCSTLYVSGYFINIRYYETESTAGYSTFNNISLSTSSRCLIPGLINLLMVSRLRWQFLISQNPFSVIAEFK